MKKFLRAGALCALLAACAAVAAAQGAAARGEQEDPCPGARTQQELNQCASRAFQKADAELNRLYQQLLKDAGAAERAKLRAAQLAWIKFRDAHCEYEAFGNQGGSIYPMVYSFCLAEVTRGRVGQFRDTLRETDER
ncbi:MAG TPA: lysozyme inhibitor LprI family protein [Pyrinomonadaceae bacterium]|nr:lysozyme inhibitor LprI family protein [Pyrinomonadaceae bacterium]